MARLNDTSVEVAAEIIARYPKPKSALIPLLHLAQEQDGWVTDEAMAHIAELIGVTPAEVIGTCTFYEMFKREPTGEYLINLCTNIACHLLGADELMAHAEAKLGISAGETTADGRITLHGVECIAACTEAPCLSVNYRYENRMTPESLDRLIDELQAGAVDIPRHGTLAQVRQSIPEDRKAGILPPAEAGRPVWIGGNEESAEVTS